MKLETYRGWAKRETTARSTDPAAQIREWQQGWEASFALLLDGCEGRGRSIFDLCALVISRWEFLGSLLEGHKRQSNSAQALKYASKFLTPVNRQYGECHTTVLPEMTVAALLFQMMRNGVLHGFTPAGVYDVATGECIVWKPEYRLPPTTPAHLHFGEAEHAPGSVALYIDGARLLGELVESMGRFADYLEDRAVPQADRDTRARKFREAFFWRLAPSVRGLPWGF